MPLIAICGLKGSGKSTLAKEIAKLNPDIQRTSFAKPIYLMIEILLIYQGASPEEIEYLFTDGKEEPTEYLGGKSVRYALQTLGTEWGRNLIDEDLWVDAWDRYYLHGGFPSTAIDDMRFPNESKRVNLRGGTRVRVERPGVELDSQHVSESGQSKVEVDYTIVNDGEPEDMVRELMHLINTKG
jgi:energy-coupling factor transporter ATP-binding protein EcfA2